MVRTFNPQYDGIILTGVRKFCVELSLACKDQEHYRDNTNTAIQENILENKAVRNKLRSKQDENRGEISDLKRIISQLQTSLQGLDIPHKVASTRLVTRAGRHQVELCRDQAHIALVKVRIITQTKMMVVCSQEIEAIKESKMLIEDKLREAESAMQGRLLIIILYTHLATQSCPGTTEVTGGTGA